MKVLKTLNLGAFNSGTSTSALQPQRSLHHLPNYPAVMFTPGPKTSPKKLISPKTSSKMNGALSERLSYFRSTCYSVIELPLWRELLNFNTGVAGTKITFMRAQNSGLSPLHFSVSLFCTCCWSLLSWTPQVCEPHLTKWFSPHDRSFCLWIPFSPLVQIQNFLFTFIFL